MIILKKSSLRCLLIEKKEIENMNVDYIVRVEERKWLEKKKKIVRGWVVGRGSKK